MITAKVLVNRVEASYEDGRLLKENDVIPVGYFYEGYFNKCNTDEYGNQRPEVVVLYSNTKSACAEHHKDKTYKCKHFDDFNFILLEDVILQGISRDEAIEIAKKNSMYNNNFNHSYLSERH